MPVSYDTVVTTIRNFLSKDPTKISCENTIIDGIKKTIKNENINNFDQVMITSDNSVEIQSGKKKISIVISNKDSVVVMIYTEGSNSVKMFNIVCGKGLGEEIDINIGDKK